MDGRKAVLVDHPGGSVGVICYRGIHNLRKSPASFSFPYQNQFNDSSITVSNPFRVGLTSVHLKF